MFNFPSYLTFAKSRVTLVTLVTLETYSGAPQPFFFFHPLLRYFTPYKNQKNSREVKTARNRIRASPASPNCIFSSKIAFRVTLANLG